MSFLKNLGHGHDKDMFIKIYIIFIQENSNSTSLCIYMLKNMSLVFHSQNLPFHVYLCT